MVIWSNNYAFDYIKLKLLEQKGETEIVGHFNISLIKISRQLIRKLVKI